MTLNFKLPKRRDAIIWVVAIILFVGILIASPKDFTAAATIALAFATLYLARHSSKSTEISKNNSLKEILTREMDDLIKPLYAKIDQFETLELVHIPYYEEISDFRDYRDEAKNFWEQLEADKYLASKALRSLITTYLEANKQWNEKHKQLANELRVASFEIDEDKRNKILQGAPRGIFDPMIVYFDWRFLNLPPDNLKDERKQKIKELTDQLDLTKESEMNFSILIQQFDN